MVRFLLVAGLVSSLCLGAYGQGARPVANNSAPVPVEVKVYPTAVALTTKQDRQSIVVQATYADGITRDVTAQAGYTVGNKALVKWDNFTLHPLADGATELKVKFGPQTISVPIKVEQAGVERPVSFIQDVIPVFTKAGCNAGGCHGASRGKDGFHLSLFGYDPDGDHDRLTRQMIGRRVNLALPEESLILTKGTASVPHTGGELFKTDSELYRILHRWLAEGAPKDAANIARVTGLEVYPRQAVLEGAGATQRLTVRATYSDGTDRDVTSLTSYLSNNEVSAAVDRSGVITAAARGEAFVVARFDTFSVGVQVLSVPKGLKFTFPQVAEHNYIDTLVHGKLRKLRIAPSEVCDDATFLRRVYIDLIGRLPTPEETRAFVGDPATGKREVIVDQLLKRQEFSDQWVMQWAEVLQIRAQDQIVRFSNKSAVQYFEWLQEQFNNNVPLDQLTKTLLTASGGSFDNPAANFYKVENDTLKLAENVAQVFLGMRIQCAQCHNHPFDRWTMDDYYSFSQFFSQVGRKQGDDARETIVYDRRSGGVRHPVTRQEPAPRFLGGEAPQIKDQDRREVLANWLVSSNNQFFARNFANRVWAHFFGKGIIDPVDDVRISNPPSNPELLDALASKLVEYQFDLRKLVRDITTSRTYQLSVKSNDTNAGDDRNFAKAGVRRLRAEVLLDTLNQVTETTEKFAGLARGARAVEIADGRTSSYFLTTFGRSPRETACACDVKTEPTLSQALHLLNGDAVNNKVLSGGVVRNLLKQGKSNEQVIEELYLRAFSRPPTPAEQAKLKEFFREDRKAEDVLNDIFWSLLNAKEFAFNH
jgi:hypothetical protein